MYFLKFTIQFIVILNIAINSIGFRYHCIGRNDKPPCFLDMIPWEHSYKKVLSKFLLPIDLEYFQNLFYRAMYCSRYLYSVNDLLKLLLTDDQVVSLKFVFYCNWLREKFMQY
uniref:Uncharacterized protein n=1 Tax=Strongyloides venezuelensis TaxID=75913 RepID=A0A0K0FHR8_STRVS